MIYRGGKTDGPCPSGDSWIFNGKQKTWKRLPGCASARFNILDLAKMAT